MAHFGARHTLEYTEKFSFGKGFNRLFTGFSKKQTGCFNGCCEIGFAVHTLCDIRRKLLLQNALAGIFGVPCLECFDLFLALQCENTDVLAHFLVSSIDPILVKFVRRGFGFVNPNIATFGLSKL